MQDNLFVLASVTFIECQYNLGKNAPNEILINEVLLLSVGCSTFLNEFAEIASFTVLHDKVDACVAFINELVVAADNILMFELSENVDLIDELLLLFIIHASVVSLLPHHFLAGFIMPDQSNFTVTT